jgi:ArsR family transcriptional regulator
MLKVARHNLAKAERRHISVRQGDLNATPLETGVADLVTLHQVLHYLDEPREAIAEAARLLAPKGKLLIVDFDAHSREDFRDKYQHRRLGFKDSDIAVWMGDVDIALAETLDLDSGDETRPDIKLWLGERLSTKHRRASWLQ